LVVHRADKTEHSGHKNSVFKGQSCDLGHSLVPNSGTNRVLLVPEQDLRYVEFIANLIIGLIRDNNAKRPRSGTLTGPVFAQAIGSEIGFEDAKDVIVYPGILQSHQDSSEFILSSMVEEEVILFLTQLATHYRNELPYHNLEHACHTAVVSINRSEYATLTTDTPFSIVCDKILFEAGS
jgi:hypothetical protein